MHTAIPLQQSSGQRSSTDPGALTSRSARKPVPLQKTVQQCAEKVLGARKIELPGIDEMIELTYPVSTHVRLFRLDQMETRRVVVQSVRDLIADPLSVNDYMRRPYQLRSRWMIKAFEPASRKWRQFYLGSSLEYWSPGTLRVGLYQPRSQCPTTILDGVYEATAASRKRLTDELAKLGKLDFGDLELRVFSDQ